MEHLVSKSSLKSRRLQRVNEVAKTAKNSNFYPRKSFWWAFIPGTIGDRNLLQKLQIPEVYSESLYWRLQCWHVLAKLSYYACTWVFSQAIYSMNTWVVDTYIQRRHCIPIILIRFTPEHWSLQTQIQNGFCVWRETSPHLLNILIKIKVSEMYFLVMSIIAENADFQAPSRLNVNVRSC